MATASEKTVTPIKQSVVTVTTKDGAVEQYPLSPLNIYHAGKAETSPIGITFHAAWLQAGKPAGSLEQWLDGLVEVREEELDVPPTNGKQPS